MSGICDTCRNEHCRTVVGNITSCDFYVGGETRYKRLFGTPERAADVRGGGGAMSMLTEQCARLRSWAKQFDERADFDALAPLLASDLREAADTIESLQALQSVSASPSAMIRLAHRLREANEAVIYLRDRLKAAEGDVGTRWHDLFGTPERAARTLSAMQKCELGIIGNCNECDVHDACRVRDGDYDALLEWLNHKVDV